MLVPNIFTNDGKELNHGKMGVRKEPDGEITILNIKGTHHSDNNIGSSPNWGFFRHFTLHEKDARKLMRLLQKHFDDQRIGCQYE